MKIRRFLGAAVLAVVSASAFALSPEYTEWGKGPVQYLFTKEETDKWKTISSDDDAKIFAALFWARRDPTPDTPRNEFREEYDRRVATADKNFPSEKLRGALTERGKAFVLYGMPKKIERTGSQRGSAMPSGGGVGSGLTGSAMGGSSTDTTGQNPYTAGGNAEDTEGFIWTYEGDEARKLFGQARAQLRFTDRNGKSEYTLERGGVDVARAQRNAIQAAITQPNLTAPPTFAAAAAAPAAAASPIASIPTDTAPAIQLELTSDALKTAVAEFRAAAKNPYEGKAFATTGEFVTAEGTYFVPVQLYVPKSAGLTASQNLTFFGVVQNEKGENVQAFEVPATLSASKDDLFVDRSLTGLPAGKNRGYFGIAADGKPVALVATDMQLAGALDKDAAGISTLILSNNVYPLSEAQRADDPFAFGGLKVVPKGDRTFRSADELWYFAELRNPGLAEVTVDTGAVRTTTVQTSPTTTESVSQPMAAKIMVPKLQVKIDVEGTDKAGKKVKMAAPPREVEAIEIKGVPGHYGVGSAIPLSSFRPGSYSMTVKIIDTVKKASYTLSEKFTIAD